MQEVRKRNYDTDVLLSPYTKKQVEGAKTTAKNSEVVKPVFQKAMAMTEQVFTPWECFLFRKPDNVPVGPEIND